MSNFCTFKSLFDLFTAFNLFLSLTNSFFDITLNILNPRKASLVPLDFIHVKQPNLIILRLNSQRTAVREWARRKSALYDSDDDDDGLVLY